MKTPSDQPDRRSACLRLASMAVGSNLALAGCAAPIATPANPAINSATDPATSMSVQQRQSIDAALAAICNDPARPLASLSALAVRDGKVVYEGQFGRRHIALTPGQSDLPANTQTLYRIASISKLITTLGVMRMVEAAALDLDADISRYLGYELRNPHFPATAISLRMLLTHTSSLRDDGGYYFAGKLLLKDHLVPGGAQYGKGAVWGKNAAPGAYFQYANLPWGVIATVMERASGERFDVLMQRLVYGPLDIQGGFNPAALAPDVLANLATLYRKRKEVAGKEVWSPEGLWVPQVDDYSSKPPEPRADASYVVGTNGTLFGPQGNARISAHGLGVLMQMLMNSGRHAGAAFLQTASVTAMLARAWQHNGQTGAGSNGDLDYDLFNAWGLGNQHFLDISRGPGAGDRLVEGGGFGGVGHLGDAWGLTSGFVFDPRTRNGLIFMHGGPGFNPATDKGQYSSLNGYEERILTALHRGALR